MGRPRTPTWYYAVGMFGTSLPINMFLAYMAFYYIDTRALDVRAYAAVMVGYAVIDAVDNPVYSYLSDRTRTRWGRRRPWLAVGAPTLALSLVAFFSAPEALTATGLLVWFAVFAILTETFDSLVNTSYGALLPELFVDEAARARVNALRQGFQLIAVIISVALTPVVVEVIGVSTTAIVYGSLGAAVILVTVIGVREDPGRWATRQPRAVESVKAILGSTAFWPIAIAGGAYASAITLLLAGILFFVKYTLALPPANATYLLATVILVSIAFLAGWSRAVARFGVVRVWRWSLAVFALAFVPFFFASSLPAAIAAGIGVGLGYSGVIATADLVVARFIDTDARRSGVHREAMAIAAFGFFNRLSAVAKSAAFVAVFALYGFVSGDEPGQRPGEAARFLAAAGPFGLALIAAVAARFVRLPAPATTGDGATATTRTAGPPG